MRKCFLVRFSVLVFLAVATLSAQTTPQMTWQGQVDGIAILHIQGESLAAQIQDGAPIERQQFHFSDRLPDADANVRVEVLQGRGYVHVIDQPRIENHFTLAVAIEDRQPGSSFYSLALYWDTSTNAFERKEKTDNVSWAGRVDHAVIVSCHGKACKSSPQAGAVLGAPVADEHYKFSKPLPDRDTQVQLQYPTGRGEIRLTEQPAQENGYTARVLIRDPGPGAGDYSFTLVWKRLKGKAAAAPASVTEPIGRGMLWAGTVGGRVQVTIEGGASFSQAMDGARVADEGSEIFRPLPKRSDLMPAIRKLHGRGQARIIEQPSDKNNYRLVFEIDDPQPGSDYYQVELDW